MEVHMSDLVMETLVLGMVQTNCYIISNKETKEAIVFDPADKAERIEQYLKANDLVCKAILLTHGHFDHILAASELSEKANAPIYAHVAEAGLLADVRMNASDQIRRECSLKPDVLLKDSQILQLAGFTIRVIHTPGHTVGGACYYFTGHRLLISGDTLFKGDIGRYDLPTGNGNQLVESICNKLMVLEDEVAVYPGHGPSTTIGYERDNNIYLSLGWDPYE
jgi:glyoxylase-like metal-dependent hydrolase (beta-lactamase superfamily II)